jgi:pSer/pThr/pTyr-binding forkhead associated (FHA) protein
MALRFRILAAAPDLGVSLRAAAPALARGPSKERALEIGSELDELRIGRQPGTEIELPFPAVSSLHARMFRGELSGDWWVEDRGSTNGTWVDAQRLSPRHPVAIRAGQRLRLATVDLIFEGWSVSPRGAETTATIARRLISDLFGVVGGDIPTLAIQLGPARPSALRLSDRDRRYLAGRADGCDLVLLSEHVSREHAAFVRRWDGVIVGDLGSRNGVSVNGTPIVGETKLGDGDSIQIGPVTIRLTDPEDRYLRNLASLESESTSDSTAEPARGQEAVRTRAPTPADESVPATIQDLESEGDPAATGIPVPSVRLPLPRGTLAQRWKWTVSGFVAAVLVIAMTGLIFLLFGTR